MTLYLQQRALLYQPLKRHPSPNLGLVVVIPACREPYLVLTLMALQRCALPDCDVEVLVVINDAQTAMPEQRAQTLSAANEAERWAARHNHPRRWYHFLYHCGLPAKEAGVGLARKIGMDEACRRLEQAGQSQGIIACLDADCSCQPNYLQALEAFFRQRPKCPACSIYFEHPLQGADFAPAVYEAIAAYELHLRYYIQAQRYAGFPMAFHTVGSSMAVRCQAYQEQGGMNRRQAGEDFYFLHKFTAHPHFGELKDTCVYPSPRPSERVPFGTGRAVGELLKKPATEYRTYALQTFEDLRIWFQQAPLLWQHDWSELDLPEAMMAFLAQTRAPEALAQVRANTASETGFRKRFFAWFDAFMVMKFAHFARDRFYPNAPIAEAARNLLGKLQHDGSGSSTNKLQELLMIYRQMEK